jgi:hypothetical protein
VSNHALRILLEAQDKKASKRGNTAGQRAPGRAGGGGRGGTEVHELGPPPAAYCTTSAVTIPNIP